ncbi:hypothetical protein SCALM49S_01103 [Streptomyces californicus]
MGRGGKGDGIPKDAAVREFAGLVHATEGRQREELRGAATEHQRVHPSTATARARPPRRSSPWSTASPCCAGQTRRNGEPWKRPGRSRTAPAAEPPCPRLRRYRPCRPHRSRPRRNPVTPPPRTRPRRKRPAPPPWRPRSPPRHRHRTRHAHPHRRPAHPPHPHGFPPRSRRSGAGRGPSPTWSVGSMLWEGRGGPRRPAVLGVCRRQRIGQAASAPRHRPPTVSRAAAPGRVRSRLSDGRGRRCRSRSRRWSRRPGSQRGRARPRTRVRGRACTRRRTGLS